MSHEQEAEQDIDSAANPYAAPGSDGDEAPRSVQAAGYSDQSQLVQVLTGMLGVEAVGYGLNGVACLLVLVGVGSDAEEQLVSLTGGLAMFDQVLYLLTLVPFGMFLMRVNRNARAFVAASEDEDDVNSVQRRPIERFTPGSMVWWFAVPFLNFVRPYQAVKAVWFCSAPERGGVESNLDPSVLGWWWAAWIAVLVWSRANSVFSSVKDPTSYNTVITIGSVLGALLCVAALRMVLALNKRQKQRASELWA